MLAEAEVEVSTVLDKVVSGLQTVSLALRTIVSILSNNPWRQQYPYSIGQVDF